MFSITFVIGGGFISWRLLFQSEENARKAWTAAHEAYHRNGLAVGRLELTDDFGQELNVVAQDLHGCMLEDMTKSQLATIEIMLHNARVQSKANSRAAGDPALRPMNSGIVPFNGGFPRN